MEISTTNILQETKRDVVNTIKKIAMSFLKPFTCWRNELDMDRTIERSGITFICIQHSYDMDTISILECMSSYRKNQLDLFQLAWASLSDKI